MKIVSIIGSHGIYTNYGGWDQLVSNLAEKKSKDISLVIINSSESPRKINKLPKNVRVIRIPLKASGIIGIIYDYISILITFFKSDTLLLLGAQGIPVIFFLKIFKKTKVVTNVGGIEWERPKFGRLAKFYLKLCFNLSLLVSDKIIFDNEFYLNYVKRLNKNKINIIPYGGTIDTSLEITENLKLKYPFIKDKYFLSVSRSLEDNMLKELCETFKNCDEKIVLISNFSSSKYGLSILNQFKEYKNIILIDGLYIKPELDLVRRECFCYIHTHTLCGSAPSLIEMIRCGKPILSIDVPQNRFTLKTEKGFYKDYIELSQILNNFDKKEIADLIPSNKVIKSYNWLNIIRDYESIF